MPDFHMYGGDAIGELYEKIIFGAEHLPSPKPGPLLVSGDTVAVEIVAHHGPKGQMLADFFTVRDGLIQRLAVYRGPTES